MSEPRVGDTVTRVVNVATGFSVECCAVTGAPVPPDVAARGDDAVRGWLVVNYGQMKARGLV